MDHRKAIITVLILMLFCGLLLIAREIIGGGIITGMAPYAQTSVQTCTENIRCSPPFVCCKFYGKQHGICQNPVFCDKITQTTREGQENYIEFERAARGYVENPRDVYTSGVLDGSEAQIRGRRSAADGLIGLTITSLAFIGLYLFLRHETGQQHFF